MNECRRSVGQCCFVLLDAIASLAPTMITSPPSPASSTSLPSPERLGRSLSARLQCVFNSSNPCGSEKELVSQIEKENMVEMICIGDLFKEEKNVFNSVNFAEAFIYGGLPDLLQNYMDVYCELIIDLSSFRINRYISTLKAVRIIFDQPSFPGEDSVWYTFPGHLVIKAHMLGCSVHPRHI